MHFNNHAVLIGDLLFVNCDDVFCTSCSKVRNRDDIIVILAVEIISIFLACA
jgi:hypothetical protein